MTHDIHGRLDRHDGVRDLVVERDLPVGVEKAWRWITESDRTAQWYGPWSGDGRVGGTIALTMAAEEGAPTSPKVVASCERPRLLRIDSLPGEAFAIDITLEVVERDGGSTVRLTHHEVGDMPGPADFGPGWEFYLGRLVAAVEDTQAPGFEEYLPLSEAYGAL